MKLPEIKEETFNNLIKRLTIDKKDLGECFINFNLVINEEETIIPESARIALFSKGMTYIDLSAYRLYDIQNK